MMLIRFTSRLLILIAVLASCRNADYLPKVDGLGTSPYGAYIVVKSNAAPTLRGELIAVQSDSLFVMDEELMEMAIRPLNQVDEFYLRYAQPKHYSYTIPLAAAWSISHGKYAVITMPINLIATISVTAEGWHSFEYKREDLNNADLAMFARFPQGIPQGLTLAQIK